MPTSITAITRPLEYPVLTGAFMQVAAEIVKPLAGAGIDVRAVRFYDVNAVLLGLAALVAVAATMGLAGRRTVGRGPVAASRYWRWTPPSTGTCSRWR